VPIVYGTADLALRHRACLKAGQTVLVLGASGGVGTAAVQVCDAVLFCCRCTTFRGLLAAESDNGKLR
jgi:NADPH:quinone reductase-like Zn-dependent oxidoreductase